MKFLLCLCLLVSYESLTIAQQSGSLPNGTSSTATHSNNYAAKVAMLTSNRPQSYHESSLADNDKEDEALKSSESSQRPASFSWMSGYSARPTNYEYTPTQENEGSSSSSSSKYSPYMMPNSIANYYTGSSAASSPASLYQYFAQYPSSIRDKLNSEESSPSRNVTSMDNEDKAQLKRLQTALLYHQVMALQEYQALNSRGGGGGNSANMAALYSQLYQNQDPYGQYASGSEQSNDDSHTSASESASTTVSNPTIAELQQQLAQTIAYRQQLSQMAGQMGYGGAGGGENSMSPYSGSHSAFHEGGMGGGMGGYGGGMGGAMGGYGGGGYGMPSSMYGSSMMGSGAGGIGSLLGSGGMLGGGPLGGGGLGSMLGSGLAAGGMGGMLGNLAGGLSSLASGGLMNSLGSIFG